MSRGMETSRLGTRYERGGGDGRDCRGEGGWEPQGMAKKRAPSVSPERRGSQGGVLVLGSGFQDRPGCWSEGHLEGMGLRLAGQRES